MAMTSYDMGVRLTLLDRLTKPYRRAVDMIERSADRMKVLGVGAAVAGETMSLASQRINGALQAPLNTAISFESAMADVRKVVDFDTPDQFAQMANDIQKMSTELPLAAEDISQIVAAAGQAGIARDELLRFTRDAAMMATAFDISAEQAGGAMTGLRSIFSLNQDGVVQLADSYNHLSNNMDATAGDLLQIANRAGSSAKLIGLSGQEVGALGAAMLALKTPPEVAATGINALLMRLATADKQGANFQDALGRMGWSAEELKAAVEDDAQGAILNFLRSVEQSGDVVGNLSDLFGAEYADDIAKLVGSLDTYEQAVRLAGDETGSAGSMFDEYSARSATTENALKLMNNQMDAFKNVVGSAVLPVVNDLLSATRPLIQGFVDFAAANPELFKWLMMIAMAFGGFFFIAARVLSVFGGLTSAIGFLGPALIKLPIAIGAVRKGMMLAATAARAFGLAMLANPVGLIIAGIVAVGAAIFFLWRNWDQVTQWLGSAWRWLSGLLMSLNPFTGVLTAFNQLTQTLFGFNLFEAGSKIVQSLIDGLISMASKPAEIMSNIVGKVRNLLPFSPAKEGPLSDIHQLKLVETIAGAVQPQPLVNAMRAAGVAGMAAFAGATGVAAQPIVQPNLGAQSSAAPAPAAPASGGGGGGVTVQITYQINGGGEDILEQLRARDTELVAVIERAMADQHRKRF